MGIREAREIAAQSNPSTKKLSDALGDALKAYDRRAKAGPKAPTGEQLAADIAAGVAGATVAFKAEDYIVKMMLPKDTNVSTAQGLKRALDADRNARILLLAANAAAAWMVRKSRSRTMKAFVLGGAVYSGASVAQFFMMDDDDKKERGSKLAALAAEKSKAGTSNYIVRTQPTGVLMERARPAGAMRSGPDLASALEELQRREASSRRSPVRSSSSTRGSTRRRVAVGARAAYAQSGRRSNYRR